MNGADEAVSSQTETLLVQALDEYLSALQAGRSPAKEEFLAKYPALAEELHRCLSSLDLLHQADPARLARQDGLGEPVGDFRILREIGRGGMGLVYEAQQMSLGRRVALKILPFAAVLDPRQLQRFKNEAQAAASLDHPNIVHVYAFGCDRGVHYFAMQYIEGRSLAQVIRGLSEPDITQEWTPGRGPGEAEASQPAARSQSACEVSTDSARASATLQTVAAPLENLSTKSPPLTTTQWTAADLIIQAAEALEYAHQMGVVHRDIKPSNLLLDAHGHLWITDFGLAMTRRDPSMTATGDVVGTPLYMSPEQARGHRAVIDHRTDIYSLGVTLYELLTLRPPFIGDDRQAILRDIAEREPPRPRNIDRAVPRDLETIVLKAMAKDPAERYASARALAEDLRQFQEHRPIVARRPSWFDRSAKWAWRQRVAVATGVLLLMVATAGLAVSTLLVSHQRDIAQAAAESERNARAELQRQQQVAEFNLHTAVQQQERAELNLRRAMETVDQTLTALTDKRWTDLPQLEPMRRTLLEKTVFSLHQLGQQSSSDATVRLEIARAHTRAGTMLHRPGEERQAEEAFRTAIALAGSLQTESQDGPKYRHHLAESHRGLADLLVRTRRRQEAEDAYLQALELERRLVAEFPKTAEYQDGRGMTCVGLGCLLTATKRPDEGERVLREGLAVYTRLSTDAPKVARFRINLAVIDNNLGVLLRESERLRAAGEVYRDAVRIGQQAVKDFPDVHECRWRLAQSQNGLGGVLQARGQFREAERVYRAAEKGLSRLISDFPDAAQYQADLNAVRANLDSLPEPTEVDEEGG